MKKNLFILAFLGILVILIVVVLSLQNVKKENNTATNTNAVSAAKDTYIAYGRFNLEKNAAEVVYQKKDTENDNVIFSFPLGTQTLYPLFSQHGDNILLYRVEKDNNQVVINTKGKVLEEYAASYYISYLPSRNNKTSAYSAFDPEQKKVLFSIRDEDTQKTTFETPVDTDFWKPVQWSADNTIVYVEKIRESEVSSSELIRINIQTNEITSVETIRDMQLADYSLDTNLNAYGYAQTESDGFNGKYPTQFYQLSVEKGTKKTFPLKKTAIADIEGVNEKGSYIAYEDANSAKGKPGELWVYDMISKEEQRVSKNARYDLRSPLWQGDVLLFVEEDGNTPTAFDIKMYNPVNQETTTVYSQTLNQGKKNFPPQIIGMFESRQ